MIGQVFDQIQRERVQWVREQFPGCSEVYVLLGIAEELGELVEAMAFEDPVRFEDSIGDVLLFLSGYASTQDWVLSDLLALGSPSRDRIPIEASLVIALGQMARARIKGERGIRGTEAYWRDKGRRAAAAVLQGLRALVAEDAEFERIARETWDRVRGRDWNRFPYDGHTA